MVFLSCFLIKCGVLLIIFKYVEHFQEQEGVKK